MSEADRQKWDQRFAEGKDVRRDPPAWLRELDDELPKTGRALDVAAGAGRVAVWLARRGLDVTAVDISPVGLALLRETAADEGMRVRTVVADLERDPLPEGSYDLAACFHYRQRDLLPRIVERLAPGGMVVIELATVRNLEKNPMPSRRWLAEPNEVLRDAMTSLEIVYYREGWFGTRHLARAVARRAG